MSNNKCMYIEIVGAEGAGKTSITKIVKTSLEEKGYKCYFMNSLFNNKNILVKFFWFIYLVKFLDIKMLNIFKIKKSKNFKYTTSFKKNIKDIYLYLSMNYRIYSNSNNIVILNDHSILIRLISFLCLDVINLEKALKIAKSLIPKEVFFIFIKTSPEQVVSRHKNRGRESMIVKDLNNKEKIKQIDEFNKYMEKSLSNITKDSRILIIKGDEDIEKNSRIISKQIINQLNY